MEREMVESRAKAQALIMAGEVSSGESALTKPGTMVAVDAPIKHPGEAALRGSGWIEAGPRVGGVWAGRGGDDGVGRGGFHGGIHGLPAAERREARVYALDVGRGQLDYGLRQDPRVTVMEKVNAHYAFRVG